MDSASETKNSKVSAGSKPARLSRQQTSDEEVEKRERSPVHPMAPLGHVEVSIDVVRRYCKPGLGLNVDYYPRFYRKADADTVFQLLETHLIPFFEASSHSVKIAGRLVSIPRRQTAFGDRGLSYSFSGITLQANPWTPLIKAVKDHVQTALGENFNFVLVNHYKDGLDHIGEHQDNERDLVISAPIASLSLGQVRDFVLRHKDARGRGRGRGRGAEGERKVAVELGHGSLLVMRHPTNSVWYHSLPVRRRALHPRINLTFRRLVVPTS